MKIFPEQFEVLACVYMNFVSMKQRPLGTATFLLLLSLLLMILTIFLECLTIGLGFLGDEDFTKEITELFSQLHVSSKPEKVARVSYYFLVIFIILLVKMYWIKSRRLSVLPFLI